MDFLIFGVVEAAEPNTVNTMGINIVNWTTTGSPVTGPMAAASWRPRLMIF